MENNLKHEARIMWLHITFIFIKGISKYMATAYAIFSIYYMVSSLCIIEYARPALT